MWQGRGLAMLCTGAEEYGVATVQRTLAEAWPDMLVICLGSGGQTEWMRTHIDNLREVPGLSTWSRADSRMATARSIPGLVPAARTTAKKLEPVLGEAGIETVYVHWLPQVAIGSFLRPKGFRVVWHLHNHSAPGRAEVARRMVNHQLAAKGTDHLLAVSESVARYWRDAGPEVTVVRNGAAPNPALVAGMAHPAAASSPTPSSVGPVRCVSAGRLEIDKGHHIALGAVAAAVAAGCDVELDVCGGPLDGAYAQDLRAQIERAGLHDRVHLLGRVDDLRRRHLSYHLGFQSRISAEPCSVWVAEAQADGLPLIASANGGTPELIVDGETGVLVTPNSTTEASQVLIELCRDRQRIAGMAAATKARADVHQIDRQIAETAALFRRWHADP